MIVGIKRDMIMSPLSFVDVNNCGFDYIGSLCAKVDINYRMLPDAYVDIFYAKKLGKMYCVNFGHVLDEPDWAHGERDIANVDIFVKRKGEEKNDREKNN